MKLLFMLLCFVCTQASNPPKTDSSNQPKTEVKKSVGQKKAPKAASFKLAPSILIF